MVKDKRTIGQKIKEQRNSMNMTQEELSRKANIPYTTLVKIETGRVLNPTVKTLDKIAKALKLSIDKLLEDDSK